MYQVLKPVYQVTGERTTMGQEWWRVKEWTLLGTAVDMADAKAKFGGAPVLQWVKSQ